MMIENDVGISIAQIFTKANVILDRISRIRRKTNSMSHFLFILQEYPEFSGCRHFHPSANLNSYISKQMSLKKFVDPVAVSGTVRTTPEGSFFDLVQENPASG